MYTIIKKEFIGAESGTSMFRVELVVDTESDIPTPEAYWSAGSMALIADTQAIKILNNKKEWA